MDVIGVPSRRRMLETRSIRSSSPASLISHSWTQRNPSSVSVSYKRTTNVPASRMFPSASPVRFVSSDSLELSSAINGDHMRNNEKEQLQGLNDRFANYIDRVRYLEEQNKLLETEIQELRQKKFTQSQLSDVFDQELSELRSTLEQLHREKAQMVLDADNIEEDIQRLQSRYEDEARFREKTEMAIRALGKEKGESELMKLDLEKKVQSLLDEADFLRSNHEEEVSELLAQLQEAQVPVDLREFSKTDITSALREIRAQLDGLSSRNLQQAEDVFQCRYAKLTDAADQNKDAIKAVRDEIADYRRQLQVRNVELEALRGTKESLERQLSDIEDRHNNDLGSYQEMIHQLESELKAMKMEMSRHLREYQDLLNVKMALDAEIAAYRKLLEGEETRFRGFADSLPSPAFPYRQPMRKEDKPSDLTDDLAAVAEELQAEKEEEEAEEEEEEVVVASKQPKESATPPAGEEEESGEEEKGEEEGKEDGEEEEEEGQEEEEEEGGGEEEESEIEETELSSSKAQKTDTEKEEEEGEEGEEKETDEGGEEEKVEAEEQEETSKGSKDEEEKEDEGESGEKEAEEKKSDPEVEQGDEKTEEGEEEELKDTEQEEEEEQKSSPKTPGSPKEEEKSSPKTPGSPKEEEKSSPKTPGSPKEEEKSSPKTPGSPKEEEKSSPKTPGSPKEEEKSSPKTPGSPKEEEKSSPKTPGSPKEEEKSSPKTPGSPKEEEKSSPKTPGSPKEEAVLTRTVETITNGDKEAAKPAKKSKTPAEAKDTKPAPKKVAKTSSPASKGVKEK